MHRVMLMCEWRSSNTPRATLWEFQCRKLQLRDLALVSLEELGTLRVPDSREGVVQSQLRAGTQLSPENCLFKRLRR